MTHGQRSYRVQYRGYLLFCQTRIFGYMRQNLRFGLLVSDYLCHACPPFQKHVVMVIVSRIL